MPELRWILIVAGLVILLAVYLWGRRISPRAEEKETILRSRAEPLISGPELTPDPYINEAFAIDPELKAEPVSVAQEEASWPVGSDEPLVSESSRREPVFNDDDDIVVDTDDEPSVAPEEEAALAATMGLEEIETTAPFPAAALAVAPPPRRPRTPTLRKILVLRLAAGPSRLAGDKLRAAFAAQGLTYGKYEIFHYIHVGGETLFSVASMVEPGSFELDRMDTALYPGVTLFAQLPASISGHDVLEELLRNAKLLQGAVGGTLQDERGGLLNSPRIQRLRQEVMDFEQLCSSQESELTDTPMAR